MRILVAGSSGLIGDHLVSFLRQQGHKVVRLVRNKKDLSDDVVYWNPETGACSLAQLEGFDAVINLAGESITGRWTAKKKQLIRDSRVNGTRLLCHCLGQLQKPPKTLVNASAMGYYGSQGDKELTENSPSGQGFLAEVCRDWEGAAVIAQSYGIRVVRLRFGMVLSREGGALKEMLPVFKNCLGGIIGSGKQYTSWIVLEDACRVIQHVLQDSSIRGPVNAATPHPVTNEEFTKTLGRVLHRPTVLRVPETMARIIFGEMAEGILLSSARMVPQRLQETHFVFQYPHLEDALKHLL